MELSCETSLRSERTARKQLNAGNKLFCTGFSFVIIKTKEIRIKKLLCGIFILLRIMEDLHLIHIL